MLGKYEHLIHQGISTKQRQGPFLQSVISNIWRLEEPIFQPGLLPYQNSKVL